MKDKVSRQLIKNAIQFISATGGKIARNMLKNAYLNS
jgi:hypothetical protein